MNLEFSDKIIVDDDGIAKDIESFFLPELERINASNKEKVVVKCKVCGSLDFCNSGELPEGSLMHDNVYVCDTCLNGEYMTTEEADDLDYWMFIDEPLEKRYRYSDNFMAHPLERFATFDERKRANLQYSRILKKFLLKNNVEVYNKYKDLFKEY